MNKKLIAAAVVAGLAAPMAAQADVSVYGRASLEIANSNDGTTSETHIQDTYANSRIGLRWSEDLGGGMKAVGNIEYGPSIDANTKTNLSGRQAYLGLKGGFGEFDIGTVLQPYKYSGGVKYDAFAALSAQARNSGGMAGGAFGQDAYFDNAISWKKKFGMAQIWLAYSPEGKNVVMDNNKSTGNPSDSFGSKGDLMGSLVVDIQNGQVGVAYAKNKNATGTTGPEGVKNTKIFGKYSFGNNTVLGQYENSDNAGNTTKYLFLGYQLKMPAMNKLVVQVGQAKPDSGDKTKYLAAGVFHNFSKKTSVHVSYRTSKNDSGSVDDKVFAVGLVENF